MSRISSPAPAACDTRLNVADRLSSVAESMPDTVAVACPQRWSPAYPRTHTGPSGALYATTTFAELDADATRIARGLIAWGVPPGTRLALLVRPGIEFVTLVFALLRAGMVIVLVDPGIGRKRLIQCLAEAEPQGFVAISLAQAARVCWRHKFPQARWNVTVGRRWFWGGESLSGLRQRGDAPAQLPATRADDPAAVIFTSGSTGIPKGVLYTQRMFDTQVAEIQSMYGIEAGGIDLACFPLFALFNSAMGVITVLPEMDFSRPASADPEKLITAANDWQATQAFASPAVWRRVGDYADETGARIPTLRSVFSCGAPVPAPVIRKTLACVAQDATMHTPYGATECLPVATIEAREILAETAHRTDEGAGVCVGRPFNSIEWRVIQITDDPIVTIDDAQELPVREVGELIVRGPQASPHYATCTEANAEAKIADGPQFWHRMGDVGYLDEQQRFWYCGRKSQRVETAVGTFYTEVYEALFNRHPKVRRSALVGVGPRGEQIPVMILEERSPLTDNDVDEMKQLTEGGVPATDGAVFVVDWPLPVDVRHNAKINRELLAERAATWLESDQPKPRFLFLSR